MSLGGVGEGRVRDGACSGRGTWQGSEPETHEGDRARQDSRVGSGVRRAPTPAVAGEGGLAFPQVTGLERFW